MRDPTEEGPTTIRVSRRTVLGGLVVAAVASALAPRTAAQAPEFRRRRPPAPGDGDEAVARFQHTATVLDDGRILVAGGYRFGALSADQAYVPALADAQLFDPDTGRWQSAAPMNVPRAQHAAALLPDGRVLVVGGLDATPLAGAEAYDPRRDTWTTVAPMEQSRYGHAAAVADRRVIVTGGFDGAPLSTVLLYDIAADEWGPA